MGSDTQGNGTRRGARRRLRLPARHLLSTLLLGSAAVLLFAPAGLADTPLIEAAGPGTSGYFWKPSTATVGVGGSVGFKNASGVVPHGVLWTGGPEKPSCSGVAVEQEKTNWSGTCSFAQAGTYSFVCTVHPTEMKGTITVTSGEVPSGPPPPPGGGPEPPLVGSASQALTIAGSQHGRSVRGSVDLSPASVGGRLEVTLLASRAALSGRGPNKPRRAGRIVRTSLHAGRLGFSVPLTRAARRALRAKEKLALTVEVAVVPPGEAALTLRRGVVLHD